MSALIYFASFLLLASPALFRKQTRGWVIVLMIIVLGDFVVLMVGSSIQHTIFPGHALHYAWGYKIFSLAFGLIVAIILVASGKFRSRELGLSFLQAPGTGRVVLFVVLPLLVLIVVPAAIHGPKNHTLETLLFQATMPGLTEELAFRGIYLALFDRMFVARFRVFGAELGYGTIATSLLFGLGHAVPFGANLAHVNYAAGMGTTLFALIMVWIRCGTRSLVLPVVLHNLGNTIHYIMPKLI